MRNLLPCRSPAVFIASVVSLLAVSCPSGSPPAPDAKADTGRRALAETDEDAAKPDVGAPTVADADPAARAPWPPTELPLALMTTLAGAEGDDARATIRDEDSGTIATYRPGDKIRDDVEVLAVQSGVVELRRAGEVEYLTMSTEPIQLSATDAFYPDLLDDLSLPDDMSDAVQLPAGVEYTIKSPGTAWGTPRTINRLRDAVRTYARSIKGEPKVHIGDLSLRTGGPFPPHLSHQGGRDVDIGYVLTGPKADTRRFLEAHRGNLDLDRTWALVSALLDTGAVKYVFMDYEVQRLLYEHLLDSDVDVDRMFQYPRGRRAAHGVIRHWKGHRNHFHVRFSR